MSLFVVSNSTSNSSMMEANLFSNTDASASLIVEMLHYLGIRCLLEALLQLSEVQTTLKTQNNLTFASVFVRNENKKEACLQKLNSLLWPSRGCQKSALPQIRANLFCARLRCLDR
jgi:hypothetical protein